MTHPDDRSTPRTDALVERNKDEDVLTAHNDLLDHARAIERELAEARAECDRRLSGTLATALRGDIRRLTGELAESDEVRDKLADLLRRTAVALKGPEKPLQGHDWSDLPVLAGLARELAEQSMAKLAEAHSPETLRKIPAVAELRFERDLFQQRLDQSREYAELLMSLLREAYQPVCNEHMAVLGTRVAKPHTLKRRIRDVLDAADAALAAAPAPPEAACNPQCEPQQCPECPLRAAPPEAVAAEPDRYCADCGHCFEGGECIYIEGEGKFYPRLRCTKCSDKARHKPDPCLSSERLTLDTARRVCFYEQEFYVLSNFSAFKVEVDGHQFDTSEAAYHFQKFTGDRPGCASLRHEIIFAPSAHHAFKVAEANKARRRPAWDAVKVDIMREILRAKAAQHEYVRRKLLETGDRVLVENSWRDDFWGWGPNRDGKNMLGRLWMEVRAEIRASVAPQVGLSRGDTP